MPTINEDAQKREREAYERGFAAGFQAAKAESPETVAEREARGLRERGEVHMDAHGRVHERNCDCMACHEL